MDKEMLKKIWNVLFYVVLVLVVIFFVKRKFIVPQVLSTELQFIDYQSGNILNVADQNGKVIVVNFWQTWCGPCIQELPSLNEMNENWEDLIVYCVSNESSEKVSAYIEKYPNIKFVQIESMGDYGISQFPTTYIYNKQGAKVFSKIGGKDWADPNFIATLKKNWN